MTPLTARLTFLGVVALSGAITANALYFQQPMETQPSVTGSMTESGSASSRSDAPANERPPEKGAAQKADRRATLQQPDAGIEGSSSDIDRDGAGQSRAAPAEPDPLHIERIPPRGAPDAELPSRHVIRAIQRELAYRDYSLDRRDGSLDLATRIAILTYQYDAGMILTGRPSKQLLEHILFGSIQSARERGRMVRLQSDRALVVRVQRVLSRLGFGNLPENGRLGPDTRQALRDFAAFRDLPRDDRLRPRLLLALTDLADEALAGSELDAPADIN